MITRDTWRLPAVSGPPSEASFCTLLVATYSHMASIPDADTGVRKRIVGDFVSSEPAIVAAAPPAIAAPAAVYLSAVSRVLTAVELGGASAAEVLLDPAVKVAGNQVLDYSRLECHYTIG